MAKLKTLLNSAQVSYAKELYLEHGFNVEYIASELGCRKSTVTKYLGKGGVEMYEENAQLVSERESLINVFKGLSEDFADLEVRNLTYILQLWSGVKDNG